MKSQPTVTRPANVTAYTAGDVVGGVIAFEGISGRMNREAIIVSADLRLNIAAIPTGMTSFRLHLYDATPPSALADNAAWDLPAGDRDNYLGYIDLGTVTDLGSTVYTQSDGINHQVSLGSSAPGLYGYLVTNGGYTPGANSEVYVPRLLAIPAA